MAIKSEQSPDDSTLDTIKSEQYQDVSTRDTIKSEHSRDVSTLDTIKSEPYQDLSTHDTEAGNSTGNPDTAISITRPHDSVQQSRASPKAKKPTGLSSSELQPHAFMKMEQKCSLCPGTLSLLDWHWTNAHTTAKGWKTHAPRRAYFAHFDCDDVSLPANTEENHINFLKRDLEYLGVKLPTKTVPTSGYAEEVAKDLDLFHAKELASLVRQADSDLLGNPSKYAELKPWWVESLGNAHHLIRTVSPLQDHIMKSPNGQSLKGPKAQSHDAVLFKIPPTPCCDHCLKDSEVDQTGRVIIYRPGPKPTERNNFRSQVHGSCFVGMLKDEELVLDDDGYI